MLALRANEGGKGHLGLMARVARAQHNALMSHPDMPVPDAALLERAQAHGLPPLGALSHEAPLDGAWRDVLRSICTTLRDDAPGKLLQVIDFIDKNNNTHLDEQARLVLALDYPALDAAAVPLFGAALQVHWVKRAQALGIGAIRRLDVPTVCPVCGSPPVASVLHIDGPVPGTRYLHCVLCATEWYMTRGTCSQCEAQEKLAYYHIDEGNEAVRGEACEECKGYIKSYNHEKDPQADPVADDLASLALDILLDESGYERASPNYFFVPGQG